jgi:hypothetical protein
VLLEGPIHPGAGLLADLLDLEAGDRLPDGLDDPLLPLLLRRPLQQRIEQPLLDRGVGRQLVPELGEQPLADVRRPVLDLKSS